MTECRLLSLEANDFRRLMNRYTSLRDHVMAVAEKRLNTTLNAAEPPKAGPPEDNA